MDDFFDKKLSVKKYVCFYKDKMKSFGKKFKSLRIARNESLREFCIRCRIDASTLSKIERDVLPPQGLFLEYYLKEIGIEKNSDQWFEMHDLASIAKNSQNLISEEKLIEKMPVFFQTFQKSDQMINTIKQVINSAWR